ncbi:MAG: ATP-grasp domain-containing protein, partial [Flavobacteriales bacterium]|nr:ATP-grasp domain-containing protein [Flavobacteriales bacterium]
GYGTRYANRKIKSPSINNEEEYFSFLVDYIKNNAIDVVIPMSDPTAEFLSKRKPALTGLTKYILPDYPVFMTGYDKNQLMKTCRERGYPHPETYDMAATAVEEIGDSFFPAILKPNITTGGRGMRIINSKNELKSVLPGNVKEYGPCHLQEFVKSGGRQFKIELILDNDGNLISSSVIDKLRYYPVSGGSSCFNVTVLNDSLVEICYRLLRDIGWVGFADFDLIEDPEDQQFKIMEINPRIPACIKSAIESGIDYGNLIVDSSLGKEIHSFAYNPGKQLRHLGLDVLWFLQSKHRFKTTPGWFNFFNKNQSCQDFSWGDPLPFVFGTLGNIAKISQGSFRKEKRKS